MYVYDDDEWETGRETGRERLLEATRSGDPEIVREMLNELCPDMKIVCQNIAPRVNAALQNGDLELAQDLLSTAPEKQVSFLDIARSFNLAFQNGHPEIVVMLGLEMADCDKFTKLTPTEALLQEICRCASQIEYQYQSETFETGSLSLITVSTVSLILDYYFETCDIPRAEYFHKIFEYIFWHSHFPIEGVEKIVNVFGETYPDEQIDTLMCLKKASLNNDIAKMDWIERRFGLPIFPVYPETTDLKNTLETHIIELSAIPDLSSAQNSALKLCSRRVDPSGKTAITWLLERYELSAQTVERILGMYERLSISSAYLFRERIDGLKIICRATDLDPSKVDEIKEVNQDVINRSFRPDLWASIDVHNRDRRYY